jgi:capsular polysaccharide biosynthesis protein
MNLKDYFKVLKEKIIFIIIIAILCGALSLILGLMQKDSFDASILMTIHRSEREKSEDFQYDNYYSIQAAEYLANTITGWIETPEAIILVYKEAGIEDEMGDAYQEAKRVKIKQLSSHLISVRLNNKDRGTVDKLSKSLVDVTKKKVEALEVDSDGNSSFSIESEEPMITLKKYNPYLVGVFGLLGGMFVGIGLAFLREYLKEEE